MVKSINNMEHKSQNPTEPYFGGTEATLERFKSILKTVNVDGTRYKIENWLKEVEIIAGLIPGKDKVWIPYNGAEFYGILKEVVWDKHKFRNYSISLNFPETMDWWYYEPYMIVTGPNEIEYYVYEYSFYKKIKNKVRDAIVRRNRKLKRKFLSQSDIALLKRTEMIANSINKRTKAII